MKKYISLISLLLALVLLTGCGQARMQQSQSTTEPETTLSPTVTVTFPEGFTAVQIAKRLEENGVCPAADFIAELNSPGDITEGYPFLAEINNPDERPFLLEGYIFPDTYEFYRGESAQSVLNRFLKNTANKLTDEYALRAEQLGYTLDEVIILASIIQKEAGIKEQMGKVSSVLHNRIESPDYGKLQCDVTINYINDYVTDSEYLEGDTTDYSALYNTYKCDGIPAGAICNPGADAIEAALYPEKTDYFYFVTDKDDNYYYASTYQEHKENCRICGIEG
ncbi:MAG: endolytic transglycosylase MltG [Acutalibacteraceae bacterium]